MYKKIGISIVGLALFVSPLLASADTVSDIQQQIQTLLSQLSSLQQQLLQLKGGAPDAATSSRPAVSDGNSGSGTATGGNTVVACPIFVRALARGVSGSDVSDLQDFLSQQGVFNGEATGFFGPQTESAVKEWQSQNGIVSSGDASSTGWGIFGAKSRSFLGDWCRNRPQPQPRSANFSADPTSGAAPLSVTFTASFPISNDASAQYVVDFGDGSHDIMTKGSCIGITAIVGGQGGIRCSYSVSHTYTADGSYSATLSPYIACLYSNPHCEIATVSLGSITVAVGSNPQICPALAPVCGAGTHPGGHCNLQCLPDAHPPISSSALSATPTSGQAPLTVSFYYPLGSNDRAATLSMDFGDGAHGSMVLQQCTSSDSCTGEAWKATHTYTANGSYSASASLSPACRSSVPPCERPDQVVGTASITVASDVTTSNSPVISGIDGPASLDVGAQGSWTVHASVPSGGDTNLRYSVHWGDEGILDNIAAFAGTAAITASGTFTHAYSRAGAYQPTFTVSNSAGSAQTSASVVVGASNSTSALSASPTSGAAPLAVNFSVTGDNSSAVYTLDFGDSTVSDVKIPVIYCIRAPCLPAPTSVSHTYASAGTYTATLKKIVGATVDDRPTSANSAIYQTIGVVTITVTGGTISCTILDCVAGYHPSGPACSNKQTCVPNSPTICPTLAPGSPSNDARCQPVGVTSNGSCTGPDARVYANGQLATYADWCSANSASIYCGSGLKVCANGTWTTQNDNSPRAGAQASDASANLANAVSALEAAVQALVAHFSH